MKELELNRNIDKKIKYFKDDEQQIHYKISKIKQEKKVILENINTAVQKPTEYLFSQIQNILEELDYLIQKG